MNLVQNNYPGQYRIHYDIESHAFEFFVPSKTISHVQQYIIAELEASSPEATVDPFVFGSSEWGFGGCINSRPISSTTSSVLRCTINHQERHINNCARTIEMLLEGLNCLVYREDALMESVDAIQLATVQTVIQTDSLHQNCSIGSSMSKQARRAVEQRVASSKHERTTFFQAIIIAMHDAFQTLNPSVLNNRSNELIHTGPDGAIIGLLNVSLISTWRIRMECVGASLAIDPAYDPPEEEIGAQWEPHNVDSLDSQLTLLAGLSALYQHVALF